MFSVSQKFVMADENVVQHALIREVLNGNVINVLNDPTSGEILYPNAIRSSDDIKEWALDDDASKCFDRLPRVIIALFLPGVLAFINSYDNENFASLLSICIMRYHAVTNIFTIFFSFILLFYPNIHSNVWQNQENY